MSNSTVATTSESPKPKGEVIRHPDLASRIQRAIEQHPTAPSEHGRLAWLVREFKTRFGIEMAREQARKWVMGVSEPRPERRDQLAEILGVTTTWLMTGYDPTRSAQTTRALNENAAADIVAGLLKMNGWSVSVPDSRKVDLRASLRGRHYDIEVVRALPTNDDTFKVQLPKDTSGAVILALVARGGFDFDLVEVRGDAGAGVILKSNDGGYSATGGEVFLIDDLAKPI